MMACISGNSVSKRVWPFMFKIIMKRLHEVTLFVCVVNYDKNINDYCFGRLLSTTFNRNCIFPSVLSSDQVSSRDEAFSLVPVRLHRHIIVQKITFMRFKVF